MAMHPNSLRAYRHNAFKGRVLLAIHAIRELQDSDLVPVPLNAMAKQALPQLEDIHRVLMSVPVVKLKEPE